MKTIYYTELKDTLSNGDKQSLEISIEYDNKLYCNWLKVLFGNDYYASELAVQIDNKDLKQIRNSIDMYLKEQI